MKVLIVSSLYWPDNAPDSKRAGYLAKELRDRGHSATVLTAFPHYPSGRLSPIDRYRLARWDLQDDVPVRRCWVYARPAGRARDRVLSWASFLPSSLVSSLGVHGRFDVVLGIWPPYSAPLAAALQARIRHARFVFDIQDIYPDTAVMLGQMRRQSLVTAATSVERMIYRRADRLVVISEGFQRNLEAKGVPRDKIEVIPNSVDAAHFHVGDGHEMRRHLDLDGKFVVMYAGNVGDAQGLDSLLDAAVLLQNRSDVVVVIIGDGTELARLKERAQSERIENVLFIAPQPFADIPRFLRAADALVVHLRRNPLYRITIPSKIVEYMSVGKPIIVGVPGDASALVRKAECGCAVPPEDPDSMASAIVGLAGDERVRAEMGARGARYVRDNLTSEAVSGRYVDLLERVATDAA